MRSFSLIVKAYTGEQNRINTGFFYNTLFLAFFSDRRYPFLHSLTVILYCIVGSFSFAFLYAFVMVVALGIAFDIPMRIDLLVSLSEYNPTALFLAFI